MRGDFFFATAPVLFNTYFNSILKGLIIMANNFCAGCGTSMSPGAKFCPTCGKATVTPQAATSFVAVHPPAPVAAPTTVEAQPVLSDAQFRQPSVQAASSVPPVYVPVAQQPGYNLNALEYKIFGENLPAVSMKLNAGESIFTQSGGLSWMDSGITMATNMQGGLLKGLGRMVSGESLFMATFTSNASNQEIVVASTYPGSIADIDVTAVAIIAQKTAFLCAQPSVTLSAYINKSFKAGLFGGEGFVMQRLSGQGKVFLEIDGSCVKRTLSPGERIIVDTGSVAAFEETVTYQAEMVKGFKNVLFGGEGLFLTTLTGPGKIWLQTMPIPGFAKKLIPYLPRPSAK